MNPVKLNICDHGHHTPREVRLLPYGKSGGNRILCQDHFYEEMHFRIAHRLCPVVKWGSLKIYEGGN